MDDYNGNNRDYDNGFRFQEQPTKKKIVELGARGRICKKKKKEKKGNCWGDG